MDKKYLSAEYEPALKGGDFKPDPAEKKAGKVSLGDEIARARDSVINEPAMDAATTLQAYVDLVNEKATHCTLAGNIAFTLIVAIAAGPVAILGAIAKSSGPMINILYIVLLGPIVEEIMKQVGMIYMLERKPWRVFAKWQFFLCAAVAALVFAAIKNLMYIHFYVDPETLNYPQAFAAFRWSICTMMHVSCSLIGAFGMVRVWERHQQQGKIPTLTDGRTFLFLAMAIHCLYNLTVTLFPISF